MNKKEFETIRCNQDGPILRLTLNRPEVLNAINGRMLAEIREVLTETITDDSVRMLCIDSAGARAFSAGIDVAYVNELRGQARRETRTVSRALHQTFLALRTFEKPIICAIDGYCLGAGLELAVSCDIMLATDRSQFGLPNIHRGIPAIVEAAILPLCIGLQGAREMAYLGEYWSAEKAERRGLLAAVFTPEEFEAEVGQWCAKLAEKSRTGLATQKEIIHKWMTTDLESAIDFSINTVLLSGDQGEGMSSFVEKRKAEF